MNINIRYCTECGRAYDIGTNFDTCPDCRYKLLRVKKILDSIKEGEGYGKKGKC